VWSMWSYMDHWVTETPQGPQPPSFNRAYMDRSVKQLSPLGSGSSRTARRPAVPSTGCRWRNFIVMPSTTYFQVDPVTDDGRNPAELAMLNSWYLQRELAVAK
jgi:hypothetical protein